MTHVEIPGMTLLFL